MGGDFLEEPATTRRAFTGRKMGPFTVTRRLIFFNDDFRMVIIPLIELEFRHSTQMEFNGRDSLLLVANAHWCLEIPDIPHLQICEYCVRKLGRRTFLRTQWIIDVR